MLRPATSRLEVWSSSQRVVARSYRAREASGQDATREQDRANENRHHHGAHDTEPFLVGRRVGNFALENVAHRTTPSMNRYAVSRARGFLCGKNWRQLWSVGRNVEKAGWCSFWVTKRPGPLALWRGDPKLAPP